MGCRVDVICEIVHFHRPVQSRVTSEKTNSAQITESIFSKSAMANNNSGSCHAIHNSVLMEMAY